MFNYLKNIYNEVKNERSTNVTENEKEKVHHALFNDLLILDGVDTYYQEASNAITNLIAGVQQFKNKKRTANEFAIDIALAEIAIEQIKYGTPSLFELVPRHKVLKVTEMFDYVLKRSELHDEH